MPSGREEGAVDATTLRILEAVGRNDAINQRGLAGEVGVALGLTNTYLRRCIRKGWIKVRQAPARRYLYYLTPRGFTEKTRLTAEYLSLSLSLFRKARDESKTLFDECRARGWTRAMLYGYSDLAEIALIAARNAEVDVVAIIDPASALEHVGGVPLIKTIKDSPAADAVIVTQLSAAGEAYGNLIALWPSERVLVLPLLGVRLKDERGVTTPAQRRARRVS